MKTPKAVREHVLDGLLALLVVGGAIEAALRYAADDRTQADTWLAVIQTLLILLPLTVWHRSPFVAGSGVWLVAAAVSMVNDRLVVTTTSIYIGGLAASLLLGGVKARRPALLGLAITIGCAAIVVHNDPLHKPGDQTFVPLLFAIAWTVGFALRTRSGQAEAAEARAEMLDRDRERASLQAASDERVRLARELHDIVGHSVSVMTVQASGVRRMLTPDQEEERQALLSVERTGREALAEMRLLVGALRDPAEAPALAPQPSLTHIETLLQHARDAGVDASAVVEGDPAVLPAGVDLTAYRLVQEGLTNTVKHAGARTAEVRIRHTHRTSKSKSAMTARRSPGQRRGWTRPRRHPRARCDLSRRPRSRTAYRGGFRLWARLPITT